MKRLERLGLHSTAVMNAAYKANAIAPPPGGGNDGTSGGDYNLCPGGAPNGADHAYAEPEQPSHATGATNNSTGSRYADSNHTYDMQAPRRGSHQRAVQQGAAQPQYAEIENYVEVGQPQHPYAAPTYAVASPHQGGLRPGGGRGRGQQDQYNTLSTNNRISGLNFIPGATGAAATYSEFSDYQPGPGGATGVNGATYATPSAPGAGGGGAAATYSEFSDYQPGPGGVGGAGGTSGPTYATPAAAGQMRARSGSVYLAGDLQRDRAGTLTLNASQDGVKYHVPFAFGEDGANESSM